MLCYVISYFRRFYCIIVLFLYSILYKIITFCVIPYTYINIQFMYIYIYIYIEKYVSLSLSLSLSLSVLCGCFCGCLSACAFVPPVYMPRWASLSAVCTSVSIPVFGSASVRPCCFKLTLPLSVSACLSLFYHPARLSVIGAGAVRE